MKLTKAEGWFIQLIIAAVLILAFRWCQLRGYVIPWRLP